MNLIRQIRFGGLLGPEVARVEDQLNVGFENDKSLACKAKS